MGKVRDLTGMRFGRLVVVEYVGKSKQGRMWRCKCDCGGETLATAGRLNYGNVTSCGCKVMTKGKSFKDKYKVNIKNGPAKREYSIWLGIKKRCYNINSNMCGIMYS